MRFSNTCWCHISHEILANLAEGFIPDHNYRNRLLLDSACDFSIYRKTKEFQNLNGLRFICIAMVLWHHSIPIETDLLNIHLRGFLGVDFFFILSGFLITTLLLRERSDGSFSIKRFYLRRALRILPVFFFVVGVVGAYYVFVRGQYEYMRIWPYYFFFLSNFLSEHIPTLGPTWSLAVEEQYYLIWPLLLALTPQKHIVPVLVFLIVVNVLGGMFQTADSGIGFLLLTLKLPGPTYAPILMGSLLAILLHNQYVFERMAVYIGGKWAPAILAVLLFVVIEFPADKLQGLPNLAIHSTMTLLLASLVVRENTILSPFLTNKHISRVGEVSYGIYLYHLIGLHITNAGLRAIGIGDGWALLLIYALISYFMAEISYRTLEEFFQRFRHDRMQG